MEARVRGLRRPKLIGEPESNRASELMNENPKRLNLDSLAVFKSTAGHTVAGIEGGLGE